MSGPQTPDQSYYKKSSTRPPIPGEERANNETNWCQLSSPDRYNYRHQNCDASKSLLLDGRRHRVTTTYSTMAESKATKSTSDSLSCLQWSKNLHALLEDHRGLELFEHYLSSEICDEQIYIVYLWYACEGLKEEEDPSKLDASVKVIIRKVCQRPQLLPKDLRKKMMIVLNDGLADKCMFDQVQKMVAGIIEKTIYPGFLHSDVYLQYVRSCQNAHIEGKKEDFEVLRQTPINVGEQKDNSNFPSEPPLNSASSLLPTVHEDNEFFQEQHSLQTHKKYCCTSTKGEMRLTKDMLMATQQIRALDVRPKPEAFAGLYLRPGTSPYHALVQKSAQYSSYNPVSRQDSELQSLSSDARTESDNMSISSMSDNASIVMRNNTSRSRQIKQFQSIKKMAMLNPDSHEGIIPRTQWISTQEKTHPLKPPEFAALLIKKLEKIKKDQENTVELGRKLNTIEMSVTQSDNMHEVSGPQTQHNLTDTFTEKLQLDDDNDQDILDQHVSRVWSDPTPSRSPKIISPRPHSPDKCCRVQLQQQQLSHPTHQSDLFLHHPQTVDQVTMGVFRKKEKDVFSTFSGDSGNVHDFPGSMSSLASHLTKSKSMPSDCIDASYEQCNYVQGQDQRYRCRFGDATRSSSIKKSMTELTDSGVSVASEARSESAKESRHINWMRYDKLACTGPSVTSSSSVSKPTVISKKGSLPMQPFIGDPGMPLLPRPHTPTQLEECKRRLIELPEVSRSSNRSKQRYLGGSSEHMSFVTTSCTPSSQSTLRRTKQDVHSDFTTVVFSFCEEKVPYRTKIPGNNITLKQFKDVLPKKGNYRYFFKTECEDLDLQVIQEEVTDDAEVLPMWEGKIMAQVKALE